MMLDVESNIVPDPLCELMSPISILFSCCAFGGKKSMGDSLFGFHCPDRGIENWTEVLPEMINMLL